MIGVVSITRKKENVTHIRISRYDKDIIDSLKYKNETSRQALSRILADYNLKGLRRNITGIISELQLITTHYIHQDFHHCLEMIRGIIFLAEHSENQFIRADICEKLHESLENLTSHLEKIVFDDEKKREVR